MAFDPGVSEWENPAARMAVIRAIVLRGGERGELKHLSTPRRRKQQ